MERGPNRGHQQNAGDHADKRIFGGVEFWKHDEDYNTETPESQAKKDKKEAPFPRGAGTGPVTRDGFATNRGESVQRRDLRTNPPRRLADLFQADHSGPK